MSAADPSRTGAAEAALLDIPPFPVPDAQSSDPLRSRFLRAGREAVDDRELLELLLSGCPATESPGPLAAALLDLFGTAPRVLAARPDRLRTVPGVSEAAVATIKTAEALAIRMARAAVPTTLRPALDGYQKVVNYCRTLAGHREIEQFHILHLDRRNRLIADELHQQGTVAHTPVYPREVCIRCLELQASAVIAVHDHPSGDPEPSQEDIRMTRLLEDALKTVDVRLLDHIVVTSSAAVSFKALGLL